MKVYIAWLGDQGMQKAFRERIDAMQFVEGHYAKVPGWQWLGDTDKKTGNSVWSYTLHESTEATVMEFQVH